MMFTRPQVRKAGFYISRKIRNYSKQGMNRINIDNAILSIETLVSQVFNHGGQRFSSQQARSDDRMLFPL